MQLKPQFTLGSRVTLEFGGREVSGTVIEDRGQIGVGGRQLLRVQIDIEGSSEPIELEIPAADVKLAS